MMTPKINLPGLREEIARFLWSMSSTKKVTFMPVIVDHDHVLGIYVHSVSAFEKRYELLDKKTCDELCKIQLEMRYNLCTMSNK